jgi:hypothetical protein
MSLPEKFSPSTFHGLHYERETCTMIVLIVRNSLNNSCDILDGVHKYMYFSDLEISQLPQL